MANTQGMPDDFVESLMRTTTTTTSPSTRTTSTHRTRQLAASDVTTMTATERQRRRLQERMDQPLPPQGSMGGVGNNSSSGIGSGSRPAARILRASPQYSRPPHGPQHPTGSQTAYSSDVPDERASAIDEKDNDCDDDDNKPKAAPSVSFSSSTILSGTIVEKNPAAVLARRTRTMKPHTSRFVQQQQQQQQQQPCLLNNNNNNNNSGFPSVHVPLGTFCRKGTNSGNGRGSSGNPSNPPTLASAPPSDTTPTTTMASSSSSSSSLPRNKSHHQPTTRPPPPHHQHGGGGITTESLLEAAHKDAQGMLQGMTLQEIRQEQDELTKALSPETLAFLQSRRAGLRRGNQNNDNHNHHPNDNSTTTSTTLQSPTKRAETSAGSVERRTIQEEKERLANRLSQVKTHQDLDQAYHEIMKEQHPLERHNNNQQQHPDGDPPEKGEDDDDINNKNNFALACDLLRSTNPRQTLWAARVVHHTLLVDVEQQKQPQPHHCHGLTVKSRHWPLLLPVSLRCLLDQPVQSDSGYLLHTYVLRSLYSLLKLTAHRDHVIEMNPDALPSPGEVYVHCFLDDAIPSPRLDLAYSSSLVKPLVTTPEGDTTTNNGGGDDNPVAPPAAYSTESSSTSAQADGEAFDRDPMWTLLSKMKLVPRMAQLLSTTSEDYFDWPPEAWVSIMGILAMMAQRSPGAASAMAHHVDILPRIVARILPCLQEQQGPSLPNNEPDRSNFHIVYAAFRLFETLARQSRVTAKALPLLDLLPPLVTRLPTCDLEFRVQQLGLRLWRSVLRYGLGVEALEAMTTSAARHLALPFSHRFSLSVEFVSALTEVLQLAKFVALRMTQIQRIEDMNLSNLATLSTVDKYLMATFRAVMLDPSTTTNAVAGEDVMSQLFRWNTARMRFVTNYRIFSASSSNGDDNATQEQHSDNLSMEEVLSCLETLDEWIDEDGWIPRAWNHLVKYSTTTEVCWTESVDMEWEASAASFVDAVVQLLLSLATNPRWSNNRMVQELARTVAKRCLSIILSGLRECVGQGGKNDLLKAGKEASLARLGWINQSHFAATKMIAHCRVLGETLSSEDIHLVRMLSFNLLGRLQRGNESIAAVVFSQDFLFQATGDPVEDENTNPILPSFASSSSPISSMFLGELCGSEQARKQLDHSFKLQHGFGVTQEGVGAFALDSLLSDADQPRGGALSDLTLPLGTMWLWQSLSGQIRTKEEGTVAYGFDEATNVVASILAMLMEMEEMDDLMECSYGYTRNIPVGAKLYYLMNICLLTESILREDRILTRAEAVLDRYWPQLDSSDSILDFAQACSVHTDPRKGNDDLEEKDKKLLELFHPDVPNEASLSKDEMRSLEAFLDDMAEAYNDYGAQYDFFTKCIRLFLFPLFPSSIRCRALRELRGVLHLLSVPSELENPDEMRTLLQCSISNGVETNVRDPPEFLDAVVTIMVPHSCPRPLTGFIEAYSIATMMRALVVVIRSGDALDVTKKRLLQFDAKTRHRIVRSVSQLSSYTKADVVQSVLKSLSEEATTSQSSEELFEQLQSLRDKFV